MRMNKNINNWNNSGSCVGYIDYTTSSLPSVVNFNIIDIQEEERYDIKRPNTQTLFAFHEARLLSKTDQDETVEDFFTDLEK